MRDIRRTPLVVLAVAAVALTACSDGQTEAPDPTTTTTSDGASPTGTPTGTPTSPTPPTPTPTPTPGAGGDGVPALATTCHLEPSAASIERVEFAVPDGWQVEEGNCEFLDPELEELPGETEPSAAIGIRVSENDFATVSDTEEIDGEIRHVGARSGYQAVRVRGEAAGQGLRPQGEPIQLWLVDLDPGTDEGAGTLVMSAHPSEGAGFDRAAEAADRIAQSLRVVPPAAGDGPIVVTRTEGGGTPWAVTYDADDGCFQLRRAGPTDEVVDESCAVDPSGDGMAGAILADGDLEVVAGIAPPLAVLVQSAAATAPYGGVTTPVEGGSVFAYDAIRAPLETEALDAAGATIATETVG